MNRPALVLSVSLALGATFAPATAQQWEFEQVDTVRWAQRTWLHQHPELGLVVCYTGAENQARIAWWDSAWVTLDLYLPLSYAGVSSFEIAPDGRFGVVATDTLRRLLYLERELETGWQVTHFPTRPPFDLTAGSALKFDAQSRPRILYGTTIADSAGIVMYLARVDSVWTIDTVAWHSSLPGRSACQASRLCAGTDGNMTGLYVLHWTLLDSADGRPNFSTSLWSASSHGDTWSTNTVAYGWNGSVASVDLALDATDSLRLCYQLGDNGSSSFHYCTERFDSIYCADAALDLTDDGRPLIAQVRAGPRRPLALMYRDSAWHTVELDADTVSAVDIVIDSCGEPLISYSSNGIWLAHGRGMPGVSDRTTRDRPRQPSRVSIVRGILRLPAPTAGTLLDASGRAVLALKAGANDISGLAPGVYFVLTPHPAPLPQGAREPSSTISKLVLAR